MNSHLIKHPYTIYDLLNNSTNYFLKLWVLHSWRFLEQRLDSYWGRDSMKIPTLKNGKPPRPFPAIWFYNSTIAVILKTFLHPLVLVLYEWGCSVYMLKESLISRLKWWAAVGRCVLLGSQYSYGIWSYSMSL